MKTLFEKLVDRLRWYEANVATKAPPAEPRHGARTLPTSSRPIADDVTPEWFTDEEIATTAAALGVTDDDLSPEDVMALVAGRARVVAEQARLNTEIGPPLPARLMRF